MGDVVAAGDGGQGPDENLTDEAWDHVDLIEAAPNLHINQDYGLPTREDEDENDDDIEPFHKELSANFHQLKLAFAGEVLDGFEKPAQPILISIPPLLYVYLSIVLISYRKTSWYRFKAPSP